jgi:hypothetical protein
MLLLVYLLLCLALQSGRGQIRTGWDLTPPCKVVKDGIADLVKINFLDNCDMYVLTTFPPPARSRSLTHVVFLRWHAPHIANPFILMIFTNNALAPILLSGLFEIIEALMVATTKDFAVFAGAANSLENLSDVLIDDWLIQAGLGTLLGALYMWVMRAPSLWGNWFTQRRNFLYWTLWYVLLMVTQTTYGINLNDDDPTGFPLGGIICCSLMAIIFAFLVQNEPDRETAWAGRTRRSRFEFWTGAIVIYFSFYLVVMFDFFFSSAAQTWLLWTLWVVGWLIWCYARGRGGELLDLLNWQTNYVRDAVARARQSIKTT